MARAKRRLRRLRPTWVLGLSAALSWAGAPVGAQSDDENARRHFESGASYLQQSDNENALREFQAAYALSRRSALLLNIANVYERMGKLREAVDTLQKYLDDEPKSPERTTLETRITNLKKRAEPPPAPSAAPPASSSTSPVASAPLPPASSAPASSATPLAPAPAPSSPERTSTATGPNRAPAFIAFGVGGAAAIGAVVTGLLAKSKFDDADKTCKPACTDDTVSSIQSMALASDILTGVAVVGVGVGAIFLLAAGPSSSESTKLHQPSLAGNVGPRGARLEATWHF